MLQLKTNVNRVKICTISQQSTRQFNIIHLLNKTSKYNSIIVFDRQVLATNHSVSFEPFVTELFDCAFWTVAKTNKEIR